MPEEIPKLNEDLGLKILEELIAKQAKKKKKMSLRCGMMTERGRPFCFKKIDVR